MIKGGKDARLQGLIGKSGVKHGLMGLPNRIIEDISVSEDERHNARKDFRVTFIHPNNSGDQKNLRCNSGGCDVDGVWLYSAACWVDLKRPWKALLCSTWSAGGLSPYHGYARM